MRNIQRRALQLLSAIALVATLTALTGCQNFFVCQKASCPASGSGGTGTDDFLYVTNSSTGSTYLNAYNLSAGTLVAVSGSPFNLSFIPSALVVNPANTLMFAASQTGGIYAYAISSAGVLSSQNSGSAVSVDSAGAMAVSPDGKYLFVLNTTAMDEFSIGTNGALTLVSQSNFLALGITAAVTPAAIQVAPSADFVVCALGTAGNVFFPFNTSTGLISAGTINTPVLPTNGDNGVAIDSNNFAYISQTNGLLVYSVNASTGVPSLLAASPYTTGSGPRPVVVNKAGTYVYVGNYGDSTISAFKIGTSGALTPLTSVQSGPSNVNTLAADNTGSYLLAGGYGATGIQLLQTSATTGALTSAQTAASGTSGVTLLAVTH